MDEKTGKRTYTVKEVGEMMGISRQAVYTLLKRENIRYIKVNGGKYRVSKKSFDDWLDKGPSL